MTRTTISALRGTLISFTDDPFLVDHARAFQHESDGLVICRDGLIEASGPYAALRPTLPPEVHIADYTGCLISPGFIDTHIHYVQSDVVAMPGKPLLQWLEDHVYPVEEAFADEAHASAVASRFCDTLLRNGTTTACVYCAVYPQSVDALFEAAERRNMRMIAGKCMMDCHFPESLRDTATTGYDQSKALIEKWHRRGRLGYAITPRWAGSSTPAQLEAAGALWREHSELHLQTHLAENRNEVALIAKLFAERSDFLDVYDHYGLVERRAVLGHCIWLSESELCRIHERNASIAHCPTSNTFLGSGPFHLRRAKDRRRPIHVGLGTDVGAGTTFSQLAVANGAFEVAASVNAPVTAIEAFYLATLGAARALDLDGRIGALAPGREADIVVLDPKATPELASGDARSAGIEDTLSVLMRLGDERAVRATYVGGRPAEPPAVDGSHR